MKNEDTQLLIFYKNCHFIWFRELDIIRYKKVLTEVDFWRRGSKRKSIKGKISNLKITEIMNFQHNNIEVL